MALQAPWASVWGGPHARASRARLRPVAEPAKSMGRGGAMTLQDAPVQAENIRAGKSAAVPTVFSPSDAIARGPNVPVTAETSLPIDPPITLPPPPVDVLPVFEATGNKSTDEVAAAIVGLLAQTVPTAGSVLLRNLPFETAGELRRLLKRCAELDNPADWKMMPFHTNGESRRKVDGMEVASTFPAERLLPCHNEASFNPVYPRRVMLACLQDALEGGESLIVRNADLTEVMPAAIQDWFREHGGVRYTRRFLDATSSGGKPAGMTWQRKCGLSDGQGRKDAEEYFLGIGFEPSHLSWEDDGTLVVRNVQPAFIPGKNPEQEQWFVHSSLGLFKNPSVVCGGDGTPFPEELMRQGARKQWERVYAFKLRPGDLLVQDNLRVQHGRMPYQDGDKPRCMVTVLHK